MQAIWLKRIHIQALLAGAMVVLGGPVLSQIAVPDAGLSNAQKAALSTTEQLEPGEALPGGDATTNVATGTADAFSQPSANMGFAKELDFKIGNGIFRKQWVTAPASTKSSDGLGPLFNARACQSCHFKDGRGHPPTGPTRAERSPSMFLRLSIAPTTTAQHGALKSGRASVIPEPKYGTQLQEVGIPGHRGEGRMVIAYKPRTIELQGGEIVQLRVPSYHIANLGYGPLHAGTMMSPRLTPQMIGLGLLEAIPEQDIFAKADPDDRDGDGISGRANRVWSVEKNGPALGRFGWKAGQPTVLQQSAEAFAGDIGIGNWIAPHAYGDCSQEQARCRRAIHGDTKQTPNEEISRKLLDLVGFYARNLAVPVRRNPEAPEVLAGKRIFNSIGCASCHTPSHLTGASPDHHLSGQRIWPYTDLLLHDMGEGLADHRPEARADGREWRTPPLWGVGLTSIVNGHTFFLHDGRARNLTEAIVWHDGEAKRARDAFVALSPEDRKQLLAFINSL